MTDVRQDEALAGELLESMGRIRRRTRRRLSRPTPLADLSMAQMELVRVVRRHPGVSVAGAAAELGVAANTVSTLVSSLVTAGVVDRVPDPADRRAAQLDLTPQAARRMNRWRDERAAAVSAALAALDRTDRHAIADALPALGRLAEALSQEDA
jgi:DNA-binding MarR family transcriptional regulator